LFLGKGRVGRGKAEDKSAASGKIFNGGEITEKGCIKTSASVEIARRLRRKRKEDAYKARGGKGKNLIEFRGGTEWKRAETKVRLRQV